MMRPLFVGAALVVALSSQALGQSVAVEVAPADRAKIKEYVQKQKVPEARLNEQVLFGSKVPADVELRWVPPDWGPTVTRYRYVHTGDRVIFVEPSSRRVVRIVE